MLYSTLMSVIFSAGVHLYKDHTSYSFYFLLLASFVKQQKCVTGKSTWVSLRKMTIYVCWSDRFNKEQLNPLKYGNATEHCSHFFIITYLKQKKKKSEQWLTAGWNSCFHFAHLIKCNSRCNTWSNRTATIAHVYIHDKRSASGRFLWQI